MDTITFVGLLVVAVIVILIIAITVYDIFYETKVVRGFCKYWSEEVMGTWSIVGKLIGTIMSNTVCELYWF